MKKEIKNDREFKNLRNFVIFVAITICINVIALLVTDHMKITTAIILVIYIFVGFIFISNSMDKLQKYEDKKKGEDIEDKTGRR